MSDPIKCDFCDSKADAKEGDKPTYFCAKCWIRQHGKRPVHGKYKGKKK